ncbi:tRNA (guanosine(46)-N7)-methyltransferase TrmB [Thiohalobacter thiocyanaticus]|uniref:tRNA (guanine-N(7)-)-methyltransferase n=1 Tax=Thiohalobacter thiocyanaticus TaxID=585455 RepID=A0A426QIT8_9GAMM|nr:tRNA (guanosine(46)-N7)-methyltransferase TrmB [Thiohalobacter thiocyanaticus]RRQ21673.1 tRNA (guanosine(46)-N7)-methyltransferase TrmB [Thiohalobacter thiocyanaticus]
MTDHPRRIRSFVRREGRLTPSQQRALDELLPRYGLDPAGPLDLDAAFGRHAPRTLEIGFGNGASLAEMAAAAPEQDFIGIEVHRPGVGHLLRLIAERELTNVRVICADAVEVLRDAIPEASLSRVLLYFPDPWPKKKHHKRRILQPDFVALAARRLAPGGVFHLATDWEDYAGQMLEVMEASPGFTNQAGPGRFAERPADRPPTKFEQRGQRLGHGVWDLLYTRQPPQEDADPGGL